VRLTLAGNQQQRLTMVYVQRGRMSREVKGKPPRTNLKERNPTVRTALLSSKQSPSFEARSERVSLDDKLKFVGHSN
jgi:hypothetical protein